MSGMDEASVNQNYWDEIHSSAESKDVVYRHAGEVALENVGIGFPASEPERRQGSDYEAARADLLTVMEYAQTLITARTAEQIIA